MHGREGFVLGSHGQSEARVYVVIDIPLPRTEPAIELERVMIVEPRYTSTAPRGGAQGTSTGPRNPHQEVWPPKPAPLLDLPDALPATKAQRVFIDDELVARWQEEARKESA